MIKKLLVGMTWLSLLFSAAVFANDAKIGVVDLQQIMRISDEVKDIQASLEKEFKPRRDKLMGMEADIKSDMDAFKRDSAIMSEAKRKEAEQKIMAAQEMLEREGQQYQQELTNKHNQEMEKFYGKVRDAIQTVANDKKFDLVLQKDAAPFSIDKLDITGDVAKAIEKPKS